MGQVLSADCVYVHFRGSPSFCCEQISLIKQKIKEGWEDPSPHGESPQERENIIPFCVKTAASIHQEGAVECWASGRWQPLHLSEALAFSWPQRPQSLYCLHCDCAPSKGSLAISKSGVSLPKFSLTWVPIEMTREGAPYRPHFLSPAP